MCCKEKIKKKKKMNVLMKQMNFTINLSHELPGNFTGRSV